MAVRLYEFIGENVRQRRRILELTQSQLAESSGLKRSTISNLEIGIQKVPLEQLLQVARALSCDYRDLLPSPQDIPAVIRGPLLADNLRQDAPATAEFIERLRAEKADRRRRPKR